MPAAQAPILIVGSVAVRERGLADVDPGGSAPRAGGSLDEVLDGRAELPGRCRELVGGDH
ncbi:MAG: hypothetical protein PHS18_04140 [Sphaerochaetaceae bacterium]|nr:hypothetical protein [Sphaerochaetaceae bacterium]